MKYQHVFNKMPQPLLELITEQAWCRSMIRQGEEMAALLTNKSHLAVLVEHMSIAETQTLRLIVSAFGCEPFTKDALDKQAAVFMAGAEAMVGLTGLRKFGVIAAFRKAWGEQIFVLPEDGFDIWQSLLFPDIELRTIEGDPELELLEIVSTSARGLAQQLFHFLVACNQQQSLPLTNKGTLHKKQLQKLSANLVAPMTPLLSTGLSYAYRDVYDENIALMLEMAVRLGILVHTGDRFLIEQKAISEWLQRSYGEQQSQLYAIWRQLYLPAPAWLQHGISLMDRASSHLWYRLEDLVTWIDCCSMHKSREEEPMTRKRLMEQWIEPLIAFRWLEVASDEHGCTWFRWLIPRNSLTGYNGKNKDEDKVETEIPRQRSLYVQPDFELLLPPDVSLYTEWEIAAFADLQSSDQVRTYRITKESFHRASEGGIDSDVIVRFLHEHACYEVPEHVVTTLQQWDRQSGKLHIEEVILLRCESDDVADTLLRNEKCMPFLQNRLGTAAFIIQPEHLSVVRKCLEQMGYNPRYMGIGSKPQAISSAADEVNSPELNTASAKLQGLFYSRDSIQLYEIDPALPQWDNLYPDMADIPSLWLKEFRNYHGSTRKEMIRKAIEWKSSLQLRKQGRNRFIIPKAIYEERSGWTLLGMEESQEITLKSEDWEEMKLILPGINDAEREETF
jgi:hypothetical protein